MNILLINHYAGSPRHGMEFRPYYLSREWAALGHNVTVVASDFSHLRHVNPQVEAGTRTENLDGVTYFWIHTRPYQGNGAARLLNMAQFCMALRKLERQFLAMKPDIVIASSTYPYDAWPARRIARIAKAKFVFEVHDLWPLTPQLIGGFSAWHPMIFSMQMAENYAYRHADKVVSLLPGTEAHMLQHGLANGKFVHIPNGFDPQAEPSPLPEPVMREIGRFSVDFSAICVYAGGHALSNALQPFIDAAARPETSNVGFVLVGKGVEKPRLQALVRNRGLRNVLFVDPIPKTAIPSLLSLASMAYIGWQDSQLYAHGTSPNKLFDYMTAGIPVVHSTSSPFDLVRTADCGISVPAEDVPAIARAIGNIAAMPQAERHRLGENGRRFVSEHHAYPTLARRFVDAMQ